MAYNTSLDNAMRYAPDLILDSGSTLTDTEATLIWEDQYRHVNLCLAAAGIEIDVAPSTSDAYKLIQNIEARLTSGECIRATYGIADSGDAPQARVLIEAALDLLDKIMENPQILSDMGATSGVPSASDAAKIGSYQLDEAQTDLDVPTAEEMRFHLDEDES